MGFQHMMMVLPTVLCAIVTDNNVVIYEILKRFAMLSLLLLLLVAHN